MVERVIECRGCGVPSRFETPDCSEHGAACPELACVLCGWALVLAADLEAARPVEPMRSVEMRSVASA